MESGYGALSKDIVKKKAFKIRRTEPAIRNVVLWRNPREEKTGNSGRAALPWVTQRLGGPKTREWSRAKPTRNVKAPVAMAEKKNTVLASAPSKRA